MLGEVYRMDDSAVWMFMAGAGCMAGAECMASAGYSLCLSLYDVILHKAISA